LAHRYEKVLDTSICARHNNPLGWSNKCKIKKHAEHHLVEIGNDIISCRIRYCSIPRLFEPTVGEVNCEMDSLWYTRSMEDFDCSSWRLGYCETYLVFHSPLESPKLGPKCHACQQVLPGGVVAASNHIHLDAPSLASIIKAAMHLVILR